jgi:hypothetical protein
MLLAVGLTAGGAAALVVTWLGISRTVDVSDQTSFVMSGGFGGLALLGVGLGLLLVQSRRYAAAIERREFDAAAMAIRDIAEVLAARASVRADDELSVSERQRRRRAGRRTSRDRS